MYSKDKIYKLIDLSSFKYQSIIYQEKLDLDKEIKKSF